jgi:hypothetical protein
VKGLLKGEIPKLVLYRRRFKDNLYFAPENWYFHSPSVLLDGTASCPLAGCPVCEPQLLGLHRIGLYLSGLLGMDVPRLWDRLSDWRGRKPVQFGDSSQFTRLTHSFMDRSFPVAAASSSDKKITRV